MQGISVGRTLAFLFAGWFGMIALGSLAAVLPPIPGQLPLPPPDVALIVVLYVGLTARGEVASVCGIAFVLGYFVDLFAGAPKGEHMLAYALLGLAVRGASARLLVRGALYTAAVTALFTLAFGALVVTLRHLLFPEVGWGALRRIPVETLITALCAPLVFRVLRRIDRFFLRDPRALAAR